MTITATSQTLFDGERVAIMKFYASMSTTENESAVAKVTPSALLPSNAGGACDAVSILKMHTLTHGLEVQLNWAATAPVVIGTIPQNTNYTQDFSGFGGLWNNAGAGLTGAIEYTTTGWTGITSFNIILECRKK